MRVACTRIIKTIAIVACVAMMLTVYFSVTVTSATAPVTPATFSATKKPTESASDPLSVAIPGSAPKADVLFVIDTTGSMGSTIAAVQASALSIMNAFSATTNITFGVVDFKDYNGTFSSCGYTNTYGWPGDYPYKLDQPLTTNLTAVQTAIKGFSASGGGDNPEAYSRALYESYANSSIGWRAGAKRIVVAFGDDEPHDCSLGTGADPGRDGIVGTADDLVFNNVINGMKANNTELLFVAPSYSPYQDWWNTQAAVTGGKEYTMTGNFTDLITSAITSGLTTPTVDDLHLQASAGYSAWLTANKPANYTGVTNVTVPFTATITVPSGTAPGVYKFSLSAVDSAGVSFGQQTVTITVPQPTTTVRIDVDPILILPKTNEIIAVTIESNKTTGFNPSTVIPSTVRFGHSGTEASPLAGSITWHDDNHDGIKDLTLLFWAKDTKLLPTDTHAILTGKTTAGTSIQGTVKVLVIH